MIEDIWMGIALAMAWFTTLILYFDNRKRLEAHDRELTVLAVALGQEIVEGNDEEH